MTLPFSSATIAALATAPGPAGVAIIRMSGSLALTIAEEIFTSKRSLRENPRVLMLGALHVGNGIIDHSLAVYMPTPHTFTGEDIVEFHIHGSPLLVQRTLRALYERGATTAQPGEFSKRAFLSGKLDLIQVEALSDLINARSEEALRLAQQQIEGRLSSTLEKIGDPLRDILAQVEASIDFPEEEISPDSCAMMRAGIEHASHQLDALLATYRYGQRTREGFKVLLCGRPNVGKSSLLNLLLGKQRAIVSPISGTTRDIIEEESLFDGHRFVFCDSAGIRPTEDAIEKIGIELAVERVGWADLVLFLVDATDTEESWREVLNYLQPRAKGIWMIVNKIDLNPTAVGAIYCDSKICHRNFYLSALKSQGVEDLKTALVEEISRGKPSEGVSEALTNERHHAALSRSRAALARARDAISVQPLEIISIELRDALSALDEIIGKTMTEDILGRIFSKFCIGK